MDIEITTTKFNEVLEMIGTRNDETYGSDAVQRWFEYDYDTNKIHCGKYDQIKRYDDEVETIVAMGEQGVISAHYFNDHVKVFITLRGGEQSMSFEGRDDVFEDWKAGSMAFAMSTIIRYEHADNKAK